MRTLFSAGLLFTGLIYGQINSQNSFLELSAPAPYLSSTYEPTIQTMYSSPGISLLVGDAQTNGGNTDALEGIFFDVFNAGAMATRAVIAGRSGGNWGEISFHTQYGGDGKVYERMRIDSAGNVGIGTTTPGAMLTVAGPVQSTADGFIFPDGTRQTTATVEGSPGPQGPRGPQGSQGPQGPSGPPVHTSAICSSNVPLNIVSSGCSARTVAFKSVPGGSCQITADTGSCSAGGSAFGPSETAAVCSVCAP